MVDTSIEKYSLRSGSLSCVDMRTDSEVSDHLEVFGSSHILELKINNEKLWITEPDAKSIGTVIARNEAIQIYEMQKILPISRAIIWKKWRMSKGLFSLVNDLPDSLYMLYEVTTLTLPEIDDIDEIWEWAFFEIILQTKYLILPFDRKIYITSLSIISLSTTSEYPHSFDTRIFPEYRIHRIEISWCESEISHILFLRKISGNMSLTASSEYRFS
jgi:hypothetical protein